MGRRILDLIGWPAAFVIVAVLFVMEIIPVILGTGEHAVVDWSFAYVTIRFILVPFACVLHIAANIIKALATHGSPIKAKVLSLSSIAATGLLLYLLFSHPLPMFS
jgi:Na+-driven multidrug efflux pump